MRKTQVVKTVVVAVLVSSLGLVACAKNGGGKVKFKTENDKVSYIYGTKIGQGFRELKDQGIELNLEMFNRAIRDALADSVKFALTDSEMAVVMENFSKTLQAKQEEKMKKDQVENLAKSSKFLAENAAKPGVVTLPDSLQYQVITQGNGPKAKAGDTVRVHYVGTFIDGKQFDSSRQEGRQPLEFQLGTPGMIAGFAEAVELMTVGSKWKVFIPPQLAYGEFGNGKIPPNSLLIFEIELLEIMPAGKTAK